MIQLNEAWIKILIAIQEDSYANELHKRIDVTYSHVSKILGQLQAQNLVTSRKSGRLKILLLTEEGRNIRSKLLEIQSKLAQNNP